MANDDNIGNRIKHHSELGYYIDVYDHRSETLRHMECFGLRSDGHTWMALITAALELECPAVLASIKFDPEAAMVLVTGSSKANLEVVQQYISVLMSDSAFREICINTATDRGYINNA